MHLLCLNYPFGALKDFNSYLNEADSLFEYDVIIADPDQVHNLFANMQDPKNLIKILRKRKQEFATFMERQGLCVVILRPRRTFHTEKYGGFNVGHTNYDWINLYGLENKIEEGKGSKLIITKKDNPWLPYLKQESIQWTAYINKPLLPPKLACSVLAAAGGQYIAAAELRLEPGGRVVVLPDCLAEGKQQVLLDCIETAVREECVTPPPPWLSEFQLAGEEEKDHEIRDIDAQVAELKSQKQKLHSKKQQIAKYKKLLFETGKYQLEPVVRDALKLLGFNVHDDYVPEPNSNIEIDGMIECESGKAIVEIKGSTKAITLDDFSQLTNKRADDFKITDEYKQAILIGNGFRLRPPDERPSQLVFDPNHVIPSAERQDVSLLNTIDLYHIVSRILSGDSLDLKAIRQKLLSSKGICKFD